jgi:hypothetical protein
MELTPYVGEAVNNDHELHHPHEMVEVVRLKQLHLETY